MLQLIFFFCFLEKYIKFFSYAEICTDICDTEFQKVFFLNLYIHVRNKALGRSGWHGTDLRTGEARFECRHPLPTEDTFVR